MTASGLPAEGTGQQAAEAGTTPEDAQQLKDEIERTREQLGDAVEQLVAKADVKSMAQAKAAGLAERAKKAISAGREYRTPLALATMSLIAGSLAMREWRKPK